MAYEETFDVINADGIWNKRTLKEDDYIEK